MSGYNTVIEQQVTGRGIRFRLDAGSDSAGPYYLATPWQYFARFGDKKHSGRAGTVAQHTAFAQARAAYECVLMVDEDLRDANDLADAAELAATAAREVARKHKRGKGTLPSAPYYEQEVIQHFLELWER